MGLLTSQIDRDFDGGIYLAPLGEIPAPDHIGSVDYDGNLYLPLTIDGSTEMEVVVTAGQQVPRGTLLARGGGYCLYAPRPGVVKGETAPGDAGIWAAGKTEQKALVLEQFSAISARDYVGKSKSVYKVSAEEIEQAKDEIRSANERRGLKQRRTVWDKIERAGIVTTEGARPLAAWLKELSHNEIKVVVANATPLEATLNGCLAILARWPEQVFTGLAILKTFLQADEAIMAYPHGFNINMTSAQEWEVKCVAVSEKYPQGRSGSVLRTLKKQKQLGRRGVRQDQAVVFEIQLLRQVERAVLTGEMPTERVITISGDGVKRPGHFLVPLGLPLQELLTRAGIYQDVACVAEGSSLAGKAIDAQKAVVTQTSESYTVVRRVKRDQPHNCVRCGWCIADCPSGIDPMRLFKLAQSRQYHRTRQLSIDACVECGICSYICPSHLPIMEQIRTAKEILRNDKNINSVINDA
ncbi:MAG: hypothetical protein AMJ79_06130 [Phycisphaerae bacterium SM23_30]|nr:MAG: hypothetical protein AMJ79_06130 [Phycisphaerae bacterium SM23_30]